MADMMLLPARQAKMRELANLLNDGIVGVSISLKEAKREILRLRKMERKSAEGSQATIDRSEHSHVKKSGEAALRNRLATIQWLTESLEAIEDCDAKAAGVALLQAAACGGKKSAKAARKAPTVALFVQYLAETDDDFREWLRGQGVTV